VANSPQQVVAKAPDADVFMLLQLVTMPQGGTVQEVASSSMTNAGFRLTDGARTTINELDAYIGVYQGQIEGSGNVTIRAAHILHNRAYYMVAGLVSTDLFQQVDATFLAGIRSFRPLSAAEAEAIRPFRVDLYTVRAGDTWASIAERSTGAIKPATLAVMNNQALTSAPRPALASRSWWRVVISRPLRVLVALAAAGFGLMGYVYVTLPDVRSLATVNPKTTAFMDLRDREDAAEGRKSRRAHRWIPYSRISQNLKRAVLVAEDSAFWEQKGRRRDPQVDSG
jgi:hypothetical protein